MSFDPFLQSTSTLNLDAESLQDIPAEGSSSQPQSEYQWSYATPEFVVPQGTSFYGYDLETVPDETRFPKPTEVVVDPLPDDFNWEPVLKTVQTVKDFVSGEVAKSDLENLLLKEQSGKCRQGAIEVIRKTIEGGDEEMQRWHKRGTNPWECRIVAMGICFYGQNPVVWTARTRSEERAILTALFDIHNGGKRRVGYNIASFDDRVILARAMMLGVIPLRKWSVKRFTKQRVDIAKVLFDGPGDMLKLKTLLYTLGIQPPAGDMDGSKVLGLVESGQWELLAEYVASDAWSEVELFIKTQNITEVE